MSPLVSVIMPARNVERYIDTAIKSVRQQSLAMLELLVVDDGSTDLTPIIVKEHAAQDPRVRLISGLGRGPGAARNLGMSHAVGRWIAVVDADDEILLGRLSCLVEAASDGAHLVADNLTAFYDDGRPPHVWLNGSIWEHAHPISLEAFLRAGIDGKATDQPGYLKPLFDRKWLQARALRYDESLSIGEDYDLVARALAAGAVYQYVPEAGYLYRRHAASTSHRIKVEQIAAMIAAFERLKPGLGANELAALNLRVANLVEDQEFIRVVDGLKGRSPHAAWHAFKQPSLRRRLVQAARDGLGRRLAGW